jgi:hypothetical protein
LSRSPSGSPGEVLLGGRLALPVKKIIDEGNFLLRHILVGIGIIRQSDDEAIS